MLFRSKFDLEKGFNATCMAHPAAYMNKILIGSDSGTLQLWNFQKKELLYTFRGWSSGVIHIEPAPALDVVAVGLSNGYSLKTNFPEEKSFL